MAVFLQNNTFQNHNMLLTNDVVNWALVLSSRIAVLKDFKIMFQVPYA